MMLDAQWSKHLRRWRLGGPALIAAMAALIAAALNWSSLLHVNAQVPTQQAASNSQKTVWYFYRVKWGFQDEFQTLFTRNHLPVLREQIKTGRIVAVKTFVPTYHGDGRADWTFAVQIVFKDVAAFVGPSGDAEIQKRLYPDQARLLKEEQRRFEILDAHWDVPLNELDLK